MKHSPTQWQPEFVEIDLSKGIGHEHPDFNTRDYYLAEIGGHFWFGQMVRVWFGWHFSCGFGASGGMQFDTPGLKSETMEARKSLTPFQRRCGLDRSGSKYDSH